MKKANSIAPVPEIDRLIVNIRNQKVILAGDLAAVYGVPPKALNQAVKRNQERFPDDFMFILTAKGAFAIQRSRSQFVTLKRSQSSKDRPHLHQ